MPFSLSSTPPMRSLPSHASDALLVELQPCSLLVRGREQRRAAERSGSTHLALEMSLPGAALCSFRSIWTPGVLIMSGLRGGPNSEQATQPHCLWNTIPVEKVQEHC